MRQKRKKNTRNQPSKMENKKKIMGMTMIVRHIFQLSSTLACTGKGITFASLRSKLSQETTTIDP